MVEKRKLPMDSLDVPRSKTPRLTEIVFEKLSLSLAYHGNAVYLELITDKDNSVDLEFEPTQEGCKIRIPQENFEKHVKGLSFIQAAVDQLMTILTTPRIHLKRLVIDLEHPESICKKLEAAYKMCHPQLYRPTPSEHLKTLRNSSISLEFMKSIEQTFKVMNTLEKIAIKQEKPFGKLPKSISDTFKYQKWIILKLLERNLKPINSLKVDRFEMEFEGGQDQLIPILSALEPITLKEISIDSDIPFMAASEVHALEQWKRAELVEWVNKKDVSVRNWRKLEKIQFTSENDLETPLSILGFITPFLSTSTFKQIFIEAVRGYINFNWYFENPLFRIPEATITPGATDNNWIIHNPAWNHQINVITDDKGIYMFWKELGQGIRRRFRKAEANLAELPLMVVEKIIGPLDVMDKLSIRQTCSSLHHAVKFTSNTYEKLTLTLADNRPAIFIELFLTADNRLELEFEQDPLGYTIRNPQEGWEQTVIRKERDDSPYQFINAALDRFLKIFSKRTVIKKLCLITVGPLKTLQLIRNTMPEETREDWFNQRQAMVEPYTQSFSLTCKALDNKLKHLLLDNQLKVHHFEYTLDESCFNTLHILNHLDPKVLEKITINGKLSQYAVREAVESESWKNARELYSSAELPVGMWTHFPTTQMSFSFLRPEMLEEIVNALLVSTTWNNVFISTNYIFSDVRAFLDGLQDQRPVAERIVNSKLIKIPNTSNQLISYLLIDSNHISFTRVVL